MTSGVYWEYLWEVHAHSRNLFQTPAGFELAASYNLAPGNAVLAARNAVWGGRD